MNLMALRNAFSKLICVTIFLFFFQNSNCQNLSDDVISNFFLKVSQNKTDSALLSLFLSNTYMDKNQAISKAISISDTLQGFGKYNGYEILTKMHTGSSLILYTCLVKYEVNPVRFDILLYKPNKNWIFYNFQYDTSMEDDFKNISKFFIYKQDSLPIFR